MTRQQHKWSPVCPPPVALCRPVRVDPSGLSGPTRGQARGRRWRSTSHGYYVPSHVDARIPEQRIMEQSVRLPSGGAVTGWAGCRLDRASFFDGLLPDGVTPMPVPLATGGRNIRGDAAVLILRDPLPAAEVVTLHGIPCAVRERALFDAMRTASDDREAAVAMDMMAAAVRVSILRMRRYLDGHRHARGSRQVERALDLSNEDSRSPNETRMRLVWVLDARLPEPMVNRPVFDLEGRLLGIADLLDEQAGLVGEYDGSEHRRIARHSRDVEREDRFRGHGLEVFRVTGPDLAHPARVVARMRGARERSRWLSPERRAWTIVPPPWWEVAPCLDDILDRRDVMSEIYRLQTHPMVNGGTR